MKEKLNFQEWKAQVLLYFREAPLKEAIETQEEALGIVESRRIEEHYEEK